MGYDKIGQLDDEARDNGDDHRLVNNNNDDHPINGNR